VITFPFAAGSSGDLPTKLLASAPSAGHSLFELFSQTADNLVRGSPLWSSWYRRVDGTVAASHQPETELFE